MYRLIILRVAVLLVITVLVGRLYQLQLVDSDARRYGGDIAAAATRAVFVPPLRGEVFAADGKTVLAESVPTFAIAVRPGDLPSARSPRRAEVFARVAQLAGITSTLTLTPVMELDRRPELRNDLQKLLGVPAVTATDSIVATAAYTFTNLAPARTLTALQLTRTYSDVLTLNDPLSPLIARSNVRRYQTVTIKNDISHDLALVLRENTSSLPGVVVVEDYRRRYPQSVAVPSVSHMLGYIGRISECELVSENPATSWITSMLDVVAHSPGCRFVPKQIDPGILGVPPYQADDRIGKDGLEASYEDELRGSLGIQSLLVDAQDRPLGPTDTLRPVRDGNSLVLTIDLGFQQQTEAILRRWIAISEQRRSTLEAYKQTYKPITNGVAIALDPRTGRVLAMVSLPTYDNNVWVDRTRSAELQNLLAPLDANGNIDPVAAEVLERTAPLLNRSIAGTYPPGSTLKQFVGAAALQQGVIQPDTLVRDPGKLVIEDQYAPGVYREFRNSTSVDNEMIGLSDALKVSSNVFFQTLAGGNKQGVVNLKPEDPQFDGLGIENLGLGLRWFGFDKPTGIPLAGEAAGRVPTKKWKLQAFRQAWTTGDTYNVAIGQGNLEVTPLQLVTAGAALANGGTIYRPQLVQAVVDSSGAVLREVPVEVISQVPINPAYLAVVRDGMRRSVTEGRNIAARDDCSGLSIAGKTGTAEFGALIIKPDGQTTQQSHSWFVGFAPYDNPQIQVVVLLEGTGDFNDGSSTLAVPAATQIMQAYLKTTPPAEPAKDCPSLDK